MKQISISAGEAQNLKRQHVKHELLDYRYYCHRQEWLSEKIARLDYKLSGAVSAAPITGSGGGCSAVSAKDSWITTALAEQEELLDEKRAVDRHVNQVNAWLDILEGEYRKAIYTYVIVNNCNNADECSKELGLKNSKALFRAIERAISTILEKN